MSDLTNVIVDAIMNKQMVDKEFECRYCGKNYRYFK